MIDDFYEARRDHERQEAAVGHVYRPIAAGPAHIERDEWKALLAAKPVGAFWPFAAPDNATDTFDAGGRPGRRLRRPRAPA